MTNMIDKITTHEADAIKRLLEQYKGKVTIPGIINIYTKQVQELEDTIEALFLNRTILNSEGVQLDRMGEIVGLERPVGETDARYRILLFVQIGKNVSQGQPFQIEDVFALLTEAIYVDLQDTFDGNIRLLTTTDLSGLSRDDINFIFENMEQVIAAGVRLTQICSASFDCAFAFAGPNVDNTAKGFDDGTNTTGGFFANCFTFKPDFAFSGNDTKPKGFGAGSADPYVGGVFVA